MPYISRTGSISGSKSGQKPGSGMTPNRILKFYTLAGRDLLVSCHMSNNEQLRAFLEADVTVIWQ